ncbi:hypothetical protein A0128_15360 [Leptospira tipperaryensis]|uniref:Uncharacterized protein n=1 Tax=Leptospira tipperaryensis TaxID=2564040 RepID=A0A1D7UZT6_9LEPT|nr:hypothetical protein A0128_15360 [Leptospira tipperaryensis]
MRWFRRVVSVFENLSKTENSTQKNFLEKENRAEETQNLRRQTTDVSNKSKPLTTNELLKQLDSNETASIKKILRTQKKVFKLSKKFLK